MYDANTKIVFDFETIEILPDGSTRGSTEAYRENFRVDSCAFCWETAPGIYETIFRRGEDEVRAELEKIAALQAPVIAHNLQYEMLVMHCRFPGIELNWHADTMRLVQVFDNGGDKFAFEKIESLEDMLDAVEAADGDESKVKKVKVELIGGLGLTKAVKRLLPKQYHNHKEEAHAWIRANVPGVKKGREGGYLNHLPSDILERYNRGDVENTYRLYALTTDYFAKISYDWTFDHRLFFSSVRLIVGAKIRGVRVEREKLSACCAQVETEIEDIAKAFRGHFEKEIREVERKKLLEEIRCRKTLKGRKKYLKRVRTDAVKWDEDIRFNAGSNKQLEMLFVGELGMSAKFFTDKGSPSFKSSMLGQWGDGGAMLGARRKRLLVLKQAEALLELTKYDNRWHIDLKACGTSTGRYAGGSY